MKKVLEALGYLIVIGLICLAIWRWEVNGYGTFVWLAMVAAMSIIRGPHAKRNSQNNITEKTAISTERLLLAMVGIGGSGIPLIHLASGVLDFANYTLPVWALALSATLIVPGLWLFWRSHADLGRNWSVTTELHDEQTLITEGVYQKLRHPMYSAIWLLFLSQPLIVQNWIAGFSGPITFGVMYFVRVPYEESMMREKFGASYDAYMKRSGRLLPW